MVGDAESEHLQSALLGLWEALVGLAPINVDAVVVAEDGTLLPLRGGDPSQGTFSTWAGHFITGWAKRSVRTVENAHTGI